MLPFRRRSIDRFDRQTATPLTPAPQTKQDTLTRAQQEQIEAEIAASQPLVGPPEPPSVLAAEYKGGWAWSWLYFV